MMTVTALLLAASALCGCMTQRQKFSIPVVDGNGNVHAAEGDMWKVVWWSKDAMQADTVAMSPETGFSATGLKQESDSTAMMALLNTLAAKGGDALVAYMGGRSGGGVRQAAQDTPGAAADGRAGSVAHSVEGYGGAPGPGGVGVYGRASCVLCRSYLTAHPDTELIDLDIPANASAMWSSLRSLGFTGASVRLPVVITTDGYTTGAK